MTAATPPRESASVSKRRSAREQAAPDGSDVYPADFLRSERIRPCLPEAAIAACLRQTEFGASRRGSKRCRHRDIRLLRRRRCHNVVTTRLSQLVPIRGIDGERLETASAGQIASRVIARQRNSAAVRLGGQVVAGSNHVSPTMKRHAHGAAKGPTLERQAAYRRFATARHQAAAGERSRTKNYGYEREL